MQAFGAPEALLVADIEAAQRYGDTHGESKRVADVMTYVRQAGWNAQETAAEEGGRANAPRLTEDATMLMVDDALRKADSTQACTREEVRLAFAYLTNPLIDAAAWADETRTSIVITRP